MARSTSKSTRLCRLQKYGKILQAIPLLSKKQIHDLVEHSSNDFIRCLSECIGNILHGNVPLSTSLKQKLQRHKKILRYIGTSAAPIKKRKKALTQRGGALLSMLIPGIAALVGSLFGRS